MHREQAQIFDRIYPRLLYRTRGRESVKKLFPTAESISNELCSDGKSGRDLCITCQMGWSDLGTWGALHTLLPKDKEGNATVGPVSGF